MSIQKPAPYDFDGSDEPFGPSGHVEIIGPQGEPDERARSPKMDRVSLEPGRKCAGCGYELTGLFVGGNCPECGDKILSIAPSPVSDAYKRMPGWYISLLGVVMLVMLGLFLSMTLFVAMQITGKAGSIAPNIAISSVLQVASLVWMACVIALCVPPPEREPALGIGRSRNEMVLAAIAAVSQLGFPVSAFMQLFLSPATRASHPLWVALPALISFLCIAIVAIQLAAIARRFGDDDRSRLLQVAVLSILIGDVTAAMLVQPASVLLLGWGYAYFCWSLWSLSHEAFWAVRNAKANEARIARIKERARKNYEQARREREAEAPFGGPLP